MFKGSNANVRYSGANFGDYTHFGGTAKFAVSGNIMSLFYGDDFVGNDEFVPNITSAYMCAGLFANCSVLIDAKNLILPANDLSKAKGCYRGLFANCTYLRYPPQILPATTWGESCYSFMFYNCTSLIQCPRIMNIDFAPQGCCFSMFNQCRSLRYNIPKILTATTLGSECYRNMFHTCDLIETAPVLPALTLSDNCYTCMFFNCTNLNYIKAMFITAPTTSNCLGWTNNVSSTGTFIKNKNAAWSDTSTFIPSGWTIVKE